MRPSREFEVESRLRAHWLVVRGLGFGGSGLAFGGSRLRGFRGLGFRRIGVWELRV